MFIMSSTGHNSHIREADVEAFVRESEELKSFINEPYFPLFYLQHKNFNVLTRTGPNIGFTILTKIKVSKVDLLIRF